MRVTILFLSVAILLVGGAVRLAWIEYQQGDALRDSAERQQVVKVAIPAQRGNIFDARGRLLAGSIRRPSIYVDPAMVLDPQFAAFSLAPVLGLKPGELEKMLVEQKEKRFVWVKRRVTETDAEAFLAVRDARGLNAFGVQYEPIRDYPQGSLAAHIIGFIGDDQVGLAGIEQSFDAALRGSPGARVVTVDVRRRRVSSSEQDYTAPRDGNSIVLTIDAHIQKITETHLREAVEKFKAEWGTAVVMDPNSGEILALANCPAYDPSQPIPPGADEKQKERALERMRNRAIADAYEPGSIYKPFIAARAIQDRQTRLDEIFVINGPARAFGRRTIHDTQTYGSLPMHQVISKSSNIGMALLGGRLGNVRLHQYVREFGFGDATGVELPGEHAGLVQRFTRWNTFSTQSIPIGQEVSVTPIQLVAAFSVFCNDGILYRPRIVRGVVDPDGATVEDRSEPIVVRRVLESAVTREFRLGALVETVREGTGKSAAIPDYQVFGKTGTAQIAGKGGTGYLPGQYTGSFLGGAPSGMPRAAVVVSLYRPSGGKYYGGTVAAPAVGAILADTLAYLRVPPETLAER